MKALRVFRWFMSATIVPLLPAMVQTTTAQNMRGGHDRMRMAPNFRTVVDLDNSTIVMILLFAISAVTVAFFTMKAVSVASFAIRTVVFSLLGLFTRIPTIIRSPIPIWPTDRVTTSSIPAAPVQSESFRPAADNNPVIIVINTGNSGATDSSSNTGYVNSGYTSIDAAGQQRTAMQGPNQKIGPRTDPMMFVPPAVPEPTQTGKSKRTTPQVQGGVFGNLVLVSWLQDAGKNAIFVQNTETSDVQKITSEPNKDNFRIVEVHPNSDPKLFEAVISNGSEQGPVRFRF
jgi:hypothetical protein